MNSPQSRLERFRSMFPTCNKCQEANMSSEQLLVHLTVSHFSEEATKAFGNGVTCLICEKMLAVNKEAYKQYYVLSHMVLHFDLFAPKKAIINVKRIMVCDKESNELKEPSSPVCSKDNRLLLEKISKLPDSQLVKNEHEHNTKRSYKEIATSEASKALHLQDFISDKKTAAVMKKATDKRHSEESLQRFENCNLKRSKDFFKECFPDCKVCHRAIHETPTLMLLHLFRVHYKDKIIKAFGTNGGDCQVCFMKHVVTPKHHANRTRPIVYHFIKHHQGFIIDAMETPKAKEVLKAVFQNRRKTVQRTIKSASSRGKNTSNAPHWRRCEIFFKQTFPQCISCQRASYEKARDLVDHLFNVHYRDKIMEAFGSKGNNCQICRMEDVVSSNSRYRSRDIVRHFIKYHQDFMLETLDSDEARDVVIDALRDSRGSSKVPGVPKKLK